MSKIKDYYKHWTKQLETGERKQDIIWSNYFIKESNKVIDAFLTGRNIPNLDSYFQLSELKKLYGGLYNQIGLRMAKWYMNNYEKYVTKQEADNYTDIWNEKFTFLGETIAGERIVSISGNRKKEFVKYLRKKMSEQEFQEMGEQQAGRILRKKFRYMSVVNAKRIVRTESVNAANFATNTSANEIFGQQNLDKEWLTSLDGRERDAHARANGQKVDMNAKFIVMGEQLAHPGDSAGSAGNVINCRCASAPIPKESFTIN